MVEYQCPAEYAKEWILTKGQILMSVRIESFEWDEHNLGHLKHAHPEFELELLEEIVSSAKSYLNFGFDRYGKRIYGAQSGRLIVLFNMKKGRIARIFSVREL